MASDISPAESKLDGNFEDAVFVNRLLALRLAVILGHARHDPELQGIQLSSRAPDTPTLTCPAGWGGRTIRNPLTCVARKPWPGKKPGLSGSRATSHRFLSGIKSRASPAFWGNIESVSEVVDQTNRGDGHIDTRIDGTGLGLAQCLILQTQAKGFVEIHLPTEP